MEKKIKLSENPKLAKIIYSVVIAVLCITAIVIGIVAANTRDNTNLPDDPTASDGQNQTDKPKSTTMYVSLAASVTKAVLTTLSSTCQFLAKKLAL